MSNPSDELRRKAAACDWTAEPPSEAGWYWVDGDFVNNLKGLTLVGAQVLRLGVRGRWFYGAEYVQATKSSRFGPRIPSPSELTALRAGMAALEGMREHYVSLVESGDCGNWDPLDEGRVIHADAALSAYREARGEG